MRRSRFLPVFFTVLTLAFVIVLVVRLGNDMREQTIAAAKPPAPPATARVTTSQQPAFNQTPGSGPNAGRASAGQTVIATQTDGLKPVPRSGASPRTATKPAPQPQPQPSIISRVLAPIARVIAPATQAKPAATQTSQQPPQISSSSSQTPTSSRGPDKQTDKPTDPKDPNSDSTPPQLMSVEFSPAQIEDGQQTQVVILASDDISGVRGISGTISSPSGKALQGFATQREGDTNRYVATVTIAKNAEQGIWKISFINMSDNASNSVTLSYQQGTIPPSAVLHVVSSNSDNTPPTLKNVWADKRAIQGGEKDAIFVEAEDDKSGVNLVSAVFRSPSKIARIGAGCQHGDGNVWQCELSVPTCIDCGDWQLEQITLQDKANNLATYRGDNPLIAATKVNISGAACDSTPPVLQSLALDANDVVLSERGAIVTVTIAASDDNCGVTGASGQFIGPGPGSGGFFPLAQAGDSGTWTGRITLDPRAAKGTWRINSIQLNDAGHNLKVYYASDPLLANGVFHVR
jgi:hypothetical protein